MRVAQKYIDEEEINAMKDGEWQRSRDSGRWKDNNKKHVRAEKERDQPYIPKFHRYMPLTTTRTKALMMVEKSNLLQWPQHTRFTPAKKYSNKYCKFHREKGHVTEDCYQLKDEIERSRSPNRFRGKEEDRRDKVSRENVSVKGVINTIAGGPGGGDSRRARNQQERTTRDDRRKEWVMNVEMEEEITFSAKDLNERQGAQDDPMDVLRGMGLENTSLSAVQTPLVDFRGSEFASIGTINLPVLMGEEPKRRTTMVKVLVVDTPFAYNGILGRPSLNLFRVVVSTYHQKMKFPTKNGIGEVSCDQREAIRLNVDPMVRPVKQKKRSFGAERNRIIEEEVIKLMEAGYISEVQYTDWLANVVVVPKASGKWCMCTDFTDLNKECLKDPYPLPRIDLLVESTAGYGLFSMMDACQGYHKIFMAKEDRIKTSFITDRGIYCFNVMPFGLKNAGATYQRLVNKMFKDQVGTTKEVYVDDMLVKSRREEDHLKT
ncbi:UNVERIFIED_CONTAM: Retrovirus-related Pol polyprotein from transposon gypsy [Sesamum radiatum]|uniref:Retrovirus-related Pol polyprotein from transposon gypsy n=1 Tax=Sesamum radiatum TaxID=300843 RepID=A0AAW2UB82_SESRA